MTCSWKPCWACPTTRCACTNFYAWTYLILAGLLLLRHWRLVAELRYGFHVKVRDIVHH